MFQFPGFSLPSLYIQLGVTGHDSSRVRPFGNPRVKRVSAPNRGLSQLTTSFIGFLCQGIHRMLLLSLSNILVYQALFAIFTT
jgi:hypothetical protein